MQTLTGNAFTGNVDDMAPEERKVETLAFRVTARVYKAVKEIAEAERRRMSEVEIAIFERGLAAYQRDGLLFEPVKSSSRDRSTKTPPVQSKTG